MGSRDLTLIVQGPDQAGLKTTCRGLIDAPVVLPCRVQVVSDDPALAGRFTDELWSAVSQLGVRAEECSGPCGLDCWATDSPVAQNLLVVLPSRSSPSMQLSHEVDRWVAGGLPTVGVVSDTDDPQIVLPTAMRSVVALRYRQMAGETIDEIIDLLILAGEERRAFISYAHADGSGDAQRVFEALARRRFDVYLDRFLTAPSTDFVERIDDELRDKAMVVVIETEESAKSTWVLQEILTAKFRGYGLLAINIDNARTNPLIGEGRRLRLPAFDEESICAAVERHYRTAVVDQRRRRSTSLRLALNRALKQYGGSATVQSDGDRCRLTGGPVEYGVLGSFRPAGLREARRIAEDGDRRSYRPLLYCPRPTRTEARTDIAWLNASTPVGFIPDGQLLFAAAEMVQGRL